MKQRYEPSLEDPLYALDPLQPVAWFAAGDGALEEFDLLAGVTVRRVELGGEPFSGLAIDSAGKTLAVVDRCDGLHRIVAATPEHDCVLVFGQGEWATRVVSLATGKTQLDLQNRGYSSLAPIAGSTRLIARSSAGLEILDGETGRSLVPDRLALRHERRTLAERSLR